MFGWIKRLFPEKVSAPLDYSYEKYGAWPPACPMGFKAPSPPARNPVKVPEGPYKDIAVMPSGLPPTLAYPLLRYPAFTKVEASPKSGEYVADWNGNYRFNKCDAGRLIQIEYEYDGVPKIKFLVIPSPKKKPKKSA